MGFFKEFKDDLSQAVNELLPDNDADQDIESEDSIVNTLDKEENLPDTSADNEKMKEWLEEFTQDEKELEVEANDQNEKEVPERIQGEEEENMEDNVDLELLEALNSDEENNQEDNTESKAAAKPKAAAAFSDDDVTVISKGTTITGSISTDGSLDVMGVINGDIECLGKLSITGKVKGNSSASEVYVNTERLEGSIISEGSIKVGLGTVVIGDVSATSGVIAGAIKGEIDINGPIVIDSTAIIKGNIKAKSVQINNGAVIDGYCSLSYSEVNVDNIFE
jgi:Integral membrane protein CcmA involved in cell shape determination